MSRDLSQFEGIVSIIPAAGKGSRMNAAVPKQYLKIGELTVLDITLQKILSYSPIKLVILVVSPDDQRYQQLHGIEDEKVILIDGGEERFISVQNALRFLFDSGLPDDIPVMIHDAARPCITHEDLDLLSKAYYKKEEACLLVSPMVDTLHQVNSVAQIKSVVDRSLLVRAFTPQMARFIEIKESLKNAIANKNQVTDEVSALIEAGYTVNAVQGRSDNIKITLPEDLSLAEFYLERQK